MEKNLLLAVVLSIAVYVGWFAVMERRMPRNTPVAAGASSTPSSAPAAQTYSAEVKPAHPRPSAEKAKEEAVDTAEAKIRISASGASLSSYQYRGPLGLVELVETPEPGLFSTWPELAFSRVPESSTGGRGIAFRAVHPAGFEISKEFLFDDTGPMEHLRIVLHNPKKTTVQVPAWELGLGPGLGTVASEQAENSKVWRALGLFPPPEGRTRPSVQKLKPGESQPGWNWLGVDNRYFLAAAAAAGSDFDRYRVEDTSTGKSTPAGMFSGPKEILAPWLFIQAKQTQLSPGSDRVYDIPFYLGPKNTVRLESAKIGLERSVNFGWIQPLGRFMLRLLHRLHRITGNYGWSIILLTILLQLAMFPLTYKSLKAAMGMKKIQPEISRLQQKFKEDPKRLNMEMMELYKSKRVNPMGGCLPMLLQMPIFVALYTTLRDAWELHGAPWMFWVKDLSAHDPFYILPLVMGGIMFLQNRSNPAVSADPAQAKMMQYMPVIFTFMFLKFPAGLVLYWMTNSLLGFAQQVAMRKRLEA